MYSPTFADITREFPQERAAIERLEKLAEDSQSREMTLDHLFAATTAHSRPSLVRILERLVARGIVDRSYRVESPTTGGPIEEFKDFRDIPERIYDHHDGTEIAVTPSHLRVMYVLGRAGRRQ